MVGLFSYRRFTSDGAAAHFPFRREEDMGTPLSGPPLLLVLGPFIRVTLSIPEANDPQRGESFVTSCVLLRLLIYELSSSIAARVAYWAVFSLPLPEQQAPIRPPSYGSSSSG